MSEHCDSSVRKFAIHRPPDELARPDPQIELFDDAVPPTDESPTIISKNHPKPPSGEIPRTNNLRGRTLAHFELLEPIGVGGMAAVLRARDTQLDRFVALKILPPDMAKDPENIKRFHQEARSAAKLDHENIARVFYCGEDQRLNFIAFEFVEGDNLRTILDKRGRLPVGEAIHYVLQIAAGLAHAWRRGVVHRDIKPSNIIITPHRRAKLVDMGLARSLEPQKDLQLTQSGVTLGTFDYISPEQALEPREADVRSDIYSLGCTFYHMLTGQPPVPEGTAAKKLNHHQHLKPIDPRQFVHDLPDDAVVILDRMMAKQPKDRYQTPEHLVHELLMATRKLGTSFEVPEGVLSVEASVPNPSSRRPILLAAVAVSAVVALILLLDQTEPRQPEPMPRPAVGRDQADSKKNKVEPKAVSPKDSHPGEPEPEPGPPTVPDQPAETTVTYKEDNPTPQGLAEWAEKNRDKERLVVELNRDLHLEIREEAEDPGLRFKAGKEIIFRAKDAARPPTVRLTYVGKVGKRVQTPWAALTFESEKCQVENVRILLDGAGGNVDMIGLHFKNGRNHLVQQCEFIQAQPGQEENRRLASVVVESAPGATNPPNLNLTACCFLGYRDLNLKPAGMSAGTDSLELSRLDGGGQAAVVRRGAARIEATDCAFSPHAAVFRLERTTATPPPLSLRHCTVALGSRSAAFQLAENASGKLDARQCLFAHVGEASLSDMTGGPGSVLVQQVGDRDASTTFAGFDNRYYNLDAYWPGVDVRTADWKEFQRLEQPSSFELKDSPWHEERALAPLEGLRLVLQHDGGRPFKNDTEFRQREEKRVRDAFQLKLRARELRPSDSPENVARRLIGVEHILDKSYLTELPPLEDPRPEVAVRRELIVDPTAPADSSNGRHQSLNQAMSYAKSGDVVLIRKNGPLMLEQPIRLEKPDTEITLKSDKGFRPILTLAEPLDEVASLFLVYDGKLRLEELEFRLRPAHAKYQSQSVIALIGGGQGAFKDCAITLDRGDTRVRLAVAALREPGKAMMKMEMRATHLELDNCLVRGDGDVVIARGGRTFDIKARNTLAVLTGSFLNVEAEPEGMPASSSSAVVALTHTTTYLGGEVIRLQAGKDVKALVPVKWRATDCLFVSAAGKALVQFDVGDSATRSLKDKLTWDAGTNAYANFNDMIAFPPRGEEMAAPPMTKEGWKDFSGETASRFPMAKFGGALPTEGGWLSVTPAQFKVLDPIGFGADVNGLRTPVASEK